MLLERKTVYMHLICNVVLEKETNQMQQFCRGEAATVFQNCTDYWNGHEIVPISKNVRTKIKEIMKQWEIVDFDQIGFSYKPVT